MKVLKNNYQQADIEKIKSYPRKLICQTCKSELEYEKEDLRVGAYGCCFLDCPCCNHENLIEDEEFTLTKDNIDFPAHFSHSSVESGAVDVCNNTEIRERIQNAIKYFRKYKDEFVWLSQCGNLFLIVSRYNEDETYEKPPFVGEEVTGDVRYYNSFLMRNPYSRW